MTRNLIKIQEKYFKIIEENLGDYYTSMKKHNLSLTEFFNRTFDKTCGLTFEEMYEFVDNYQNELNRLWKNSLSTLLNETKKLNGLKTKKNANHKRH